MIGGTGGLSKEERRKRRRREEEERRREEEWREKRERRDIGREKVRKTNCPSPSVVHLVSSAGSDISSPEYLSVLILTVYFILPFITSFLYSPRSTGLMLLTLIPFYFFLPTLISWFGAYSFGMRSDTRREWRRRRGVEEKKR